MNSIPSSIKDNHARGCIGDFLKQQIKKESRLSILSAYFTIYAYQHLKDNLDNIETLDFLFGEPTFIKAIDPLKTDKKEFKIEDNNLVIPLEKRLKQKSVAKECSNWIKNKVNIKSMVKPNFLHGKMYHIINKNGVQKAILGSSNFTVNGLGLGENSNIELNMEVTDDRDRKDLLNWFEEIWNDDTGLVEDVKAEVLSYIEQLYADNDPEFIYFKMLYHLFDKFLSDQKQWGLLDEKTGFFETKVWDMLYEFQKDAVKGAINKIIKHNGCVIADSVGLGKTFEALAVIKYFELLNNKVLVLCPKKLSDNWTIYQAQNNSLLNPLVDDRLGYTVLCHTDLSRESGRSISNIDLGTINWGNYDLVVIDESHNFRNNTRGKRDEDGNIIRKSRYEKLMDDIINSGVNTKVLLLSATPVNNNLKDLRNQLYFISGGKDDAFYENTGVKNIARTMKNAQTVFTHWADPKKNSTRNVKELLERLDSSFFKILDALTIARSRKHIKTYYRNEMKRIGAFPQRVPVISKAPDIDIKNEFPSYDRINKEIMTYKLSLFNPSFYVKEDWKSHYEAKAGKAVAAFSQEARENFLIGMMKVNFLKRLESSIESFEISMQRTIEKITDLENKIKNYQNAAPGSSEIEPPEIYDEDDEELNDANNIGKKLLFNLAHLKLDLWLKDLKSDKDALSLLKTAAQAVTPARDNKLAVLKELINRKIKNPINENNRKIIIFTAFADTANYLYNNLENFAGKDLNVHIALVAGSGANKTTLGKSRFDHIITNFSPVSKNRDKIKEMPQNEEIDILIATDCISEGQNLQDCDYLVNYDIHWNPVKIIQRFGRIDRLGSKNKKIQLVNFWPTDDLNNYINLKDRVEARMALVDIAATGEENLLETDQIQDLIEDDLKFRNRQLKKLQKEVLDLEDLDENISLSEFTLDDFRIELSNYIEKNRQKLEDAPFGLYAIVPAPENRHVNNAGLSDISESTKKIIKPGVIYCLKQKGNTDGNEAVNPLSPYFLVYVRDDGTVRFNYTHVKQILEIFRLLSTGVDKPYEKLCDIFNNETDNGSKMEKYSALLKIAVKEINSVFKKKANIKLTQSRGALLIPKTKHARTSEHFELITWLIIR
ncbi:MAG: NgoFVII family restriction endonuclease [Deltaproteobacteria bacterium]|nr:NgoFVII family restriction endonuclease [Deltaproteobacteria bacterium]